MKKSFDEVVKIYNENDRYIHFDTTKFCPDDFKVRVAEEFITILRNYKGYYPQDLMIPGVVLKKIEATHDLEVFYYSILKEMIFDEIYVKENYEKNILEEITEDEFTQLEKECFSSLAFDYKINLHNEVPIKFYKVEIHYSDLSTSLILETHERFIFINWNTTA